MGDDVALLAPADHPPTARVEPLDADDMGFRARLEASLDEGYRLATVILGNPRDGEDATHDAVERAWRSRSRLRDADRFEPWFQRIIVNACRDRMRRRRYGPTFMSMTAVPDASPTPRADQHDPDAYAEALERDALGRALRELNPDQRIVVAMRFYLDLEVDEIARRLGTRSGTVKSRLHRALKLLRTAWEAER